MLMIMVKPLKDFLENSEGIDKTGIGTDKQIIHILEKKWFKY